MVFISDRACCKEAPGDSFPKTRSILASRLFGAEVRSKGTHISAEVAQNGGN